MGFDFGSFMAVLKCFFVLFVILIMIAICGVEIGGLDAEGAEELDSEKGEGGFVSWQGWGVEAVGVWGRIRNFCICIL